MKLTVLLFTVLCSYAAAKKPNFVFFLVDDLGYNDAVFHDSTIQQPNIKTLAEDGLIIENNYVAPACSPSRSQLMTGKHSWNIGENHKVTLSAFPECLTKSIKIIPEALRDLGYKNYMLGKWHLGYCNKNCTPNARGFDDFLGYYNGLISHYEHRVDGQHDFQDNSEPVVSDIGKYAIFHFRDRAVKQINDHAKNHGDKPLFLFFSSPTVHSPISAPAEYMEMYKDVTDWNRRTMKAMLTATDKVVGDIVQALKDNKMWDDTVFMFSGDNGGEHPYSSNKPLRGAKASSWEGGVRVPGFIHSPMMHKKARGKISHGLFHETDWYPTIMRLAGGKAYKGVDGKDQTRFLMKGKRSRRRVVEIHYDQNAFPTFGKKAIRYRKWKLLEGFPGLYDGFETNGTVSLTHEYSGRDTGKRGEYNFDWASIAKYAASVDKVVRLYDLRKDPGEVHNIADKHPRMVKKLQRIMARRTKHAIGNDHLYNVKEAIPAAGTWTHGWC